MNGLQPVSIIGPQYRKLFMIVSTLDELDESGISFPRTNPVQLISDGNNFYEVPLPLTPSDSDITPGDDEENQAPISVMEPEPAVLPQVPATPTPSAAAGAANPPEFLPPSPIIITRVVASQIASSDEAARAEIEAYIRTSTWFGLHAVESRVGSRDTPACALQLAKLGESIWACFFKRIRRKKRSIFKCIACGHESDRMHRAVSHQRVKWGHKPFPCTDPGCTFRGATQESLSDHRSARTAFIPCSLCGEEIMIKNMDRHLKTMH